MHEGDLVYLSGRMRGEVNQNFHTFAQWAKILRDAGLVVLNPAETMGGYKGADWTCYISIDIEYIRQASAVCLIPGWEDSIGAKFEVLLAKTFNKPVFVLSSNEAGELASGIYTLHPDSVAVTVSKYPLGRLTTIKRKEE